MLTVVLSFAVILLFFLVMSVATLGSKRPLRGGCHSLAELPAGSRGCPVCGKRSKD